MDNVGEEQNVVYEGSHNDEGRFGYEDRPAEYINRHREERNLENGCDIDMNMHEEERHYEDNSPTYGHGSDDDMNWHEENYEEGRSYHRRYRYRGSTFEQIYQCYPPIYIDRPEF